MKLMIRAVAVSGGLLAAGLSGLLGAGGGARAASISRPSGRECAVHRSAPPRGKVVRAAGATGATTETTACTGPSGASTRLTAATQPEAGHALAAAAQPAGTPPGPGHSRVLAVVTLATWVITASIGVYMLRTWIASGGLKRSRERRGGLPRPVIFGHAGLALSGLTLWAVYVATSWTILAWAAVCVLLLVVGLGVSTVTLWTPYPTRTVPHGAETATGMFAAPPLGEPASVLPGEALARTLADEALAKRYIDEMLADMLAEQAAAEHGYGRHMLPLIPAGHGIAALTTVLLAVVTAVGT